MSVDKGRYFGKTIETSILDIPFVLPGQLSWHRADKLVPGSLLIAYRQWP